MILFLVVISLSCENDRKDDFVCFRTDSNDNTTYSLNRKWLFLGYLYPETKLEECKPDQLPEMNIIFSDTNRFHAVSTCNTFEGYFYAETEKLILDSVAKTLILCPDITVRTWEEDYLNSLKQAKSFRIFRNLLLIETEENKDLVFRAD